MIHVIIWPISLFLLIVFVILFQRSFHKIIKPHLRKYVYFGYVSLLVMFSMVFFILQPERKISLNQTVRPPDIYEIVNEKDAIQLLEPYRQNEWDMKLNEGTVKLKVEYDERMTGTLIPVFVIEDETRNNAVHVAHYETPTLFENMDVSEHITLPNVEVVDENIIVDFSGVNDEHEFHVLENVLTLNQFTNQRRNDLFYDLHIGEIALVLTVPKGTALTADFRHFHLVRAQN